jgi:very-short-patch-repair endonuclease
MSAAVALTQLGGCATWSQLRQGVSWSALELAVRRGEVVRLSRGRYALADVPAHRQVAHRHTAVVRVRPQFQVAEPGLFATVDLADPVRKIALEAEGFEFHGTRAGLERDCRRYTELTIYGWRVLRYTWHDVMFRPAWVRWTIETLLAELDGRPAGRPPAEERRAVLA